MAIKQIPKTQKYSFYQVIVFLPILFLLASVSPVKAQLFDSGQILRAGSEDANILLQEYLKPFGGGFGANLNSGWFTTAKPLKEFGFDLRIMASASFVPSKDRFFDVTKLNLTTVKRLDGPEITPTALGNDNTQTTTLGATYFNSETNQQEDLFAFNMPQGSSYHFVPAPMAQFSLGLPGHTQVILRYTPAITIEDEYKINIFGIWGMVGLNPLLFNNTLPIDLSFQAGLMDLSANAQFDVRPKEEEDIEDPYPDSHWDGQGVDFSTKTFATNLLAGKQFSVLSLFAGAGYQYASTKIKTYGSYPVVVPNDNSSSDTTQEIQSADAPINFTLDGANNVHILGGFQLKAGFISISAAYTVAKYPTVRAGVGIMFRS